MPLPKNNFIEFLQVLLAELTKQQEYITATKSFCDFSVNRQKRTPKGLLYIDKFGTLSHAANVAFICLQVSMLYTSKYTQIENMALYCCNE